MPHRVDRTPWICAAIVAVATIHATAGVLRPDIINGYQPRKQRVEKVTVEPMGSGWDVACWLMPWLWSCGTPPDPKSLQPDRPIGWCSDTDTGPCP